MGNIENVRPPVWFPPRGGYRRGRGTRAGHSYRPWQPAGKSGITWQHRLYLPSSHNEQAPSCYLTFIRRAVLWDKGLYRSMGLARQDFLPALCPRFMGHMRASPADLRPPRFLSSHTGPGAQQWGNTNSRRPLVPAHTQSCGDTAQRNQQYMGQTTRRRCAVVLAPTPPSPAPSRTSSFSCHLGRTPVGYPETGQRGAERSHTPSPQVSSALGREEENTKKEKKRRETKGDKDGLGNLDSDHDPLFSAARSPSLTPRPSPNLGPSPSPNPNLGRLLGGEGVLTSITPRGSFSRSSTLSDFSRPPSSQFSRNTDLSSRQMSSSLSSECMIQSNDEDLQGNRSECCTGTANEEDDDEDDNDGIGAADDEGDDGDRNYSGQQAVLSQHLPSRLTPLPVTSRSVVHSTEHKSSQCLEPENSRRTSATMSACSAVGVNKVLKENLDDLTRNQQVELTPHPSLGSVSLATWRTSSGCLSGRMSESGVSANNVDKSEWTSQRWSPPPPVISNRGASGSVLSGCSRVTAAEDGDGDDDGDCDEDDGDDDVFAELDAMAPRTASCLLTDHPLSNDPETGVTSPVTALSPGLAALTVGCASGGLGSLSRVHLLMLDRPNPELDIPGSPLDLEWNTPIPPPPDGATTSWSDFRVEHYHQSGGSGSVSENTVLLEGCAAHSMTFSERDSPSPSSWLLRTSFSDISVGSHPGEDGEDLERNDYTRLTPVTPQKQPIGPSRQSGASGREGEMDGEDEPPGGGTEEEDEEEEEEVGSDRRSKRRTERLEERRREERGMKWREEKRSKAISVYTRLQQENHQQAGQRAHSTNCSRFEDFAFLAKYCIFNQEKLAIYKQAFQAADSDGDGYLSCFQVLLALKEIIPSELLSEEEEIYVYRILELVDVHVTEGVMMDERLFAVVASLAHKVATLDDFMRSLICQMDFRSLEMKLYKAKQLFLFLLGAQAGGAEAPADGCISTEQLLLELRAGGLRREQEEAVLRELTQLGSLDLLDFLAYLPLFILIHKSVVNNPLDDTPNL